MEKLKELMAGTRRDRYVANKVNDILSSLGLKVSGCLCSPAVRGEVFRVAQEYLDKNNI